MPTSPTPWVTPASAARRISGASAAGWTFTACLKDGLGAHSRLVKSGDKTLNITGMHANTYTGGTLVNAGPIKMQKPAGKTPSRAT